MEKGSHADQHMGHMKVPLWGTWLACGDRLSAHGTYPRSTTGMWRWDLSTWACDCALYTRQHRALCWLAAMCGATACRSNCVHSSYAPAPTVCLDPELAAGHCYCVAGYHQFPQLSHSHLLLLSCIGCSVARHLLCRLLSHYQQWSLGTLRSRQCLL